ncbi:MAG TPA: amino acid permease [Terriglobales bacterium]|nr:amino acid permease [Terriglobales bacterium]
MAQDGKIGLFLATMLVASNMVGSGIFLLPATLAGFGSMTTLGWIAAAAGALIIGRVLGRLGRYAPEPGGACAYAAIALGPFVGFQATSLYWVACWSGNLAIAVAAIGYLGEFVPALKAPMPLALGAVALIWLLTALNLLGPRRVCQLESATMFAGLIPIAVVALGGWWYFQPHIFAAAWNVSGQPAYVALPRSLVLMFWGFAGVESASIATAVVEDPARNVARATTYGVALAAVIYIAACGVIMGLIPAAALARSTAPFADAVRLMLGPAAAALVALMALVKAVGTLAGWILLTAETGQAGARRGLFPAFFARLDARGRPRANLLLMAVIMSAGVLATVSPTLGQQFGELIAVSVLLAMLLYIYALLAVWHYARLAPGAFRHDRGFAAAGIVFCAGVILLSGVTMIAVTAGIVLLSCVCYPFRRGARAAYIPGGSDVV